MRKIAASLVLFGAAGSVAALDADNFTCHFPEFEFGPDWELGDEIGHEFRKVGSSGIMWTKSIVDGSVSTESFSCDTAAEAKWRPALFCARMAEFEGIATTALHLVLFDDFSGSF